MVENHRYFRLISQSNAPKVRQSANIGRLMNETLRIPIVNRGLPSLSCSTESLRSASAAKCKQPGITKLMRIRDCADYAQHERDYCNQSEQERKPGESAALEILAFRCRNCL